MGILADGTEQEFGVLWKRLARSGDSKNNSIRGDFVNAITAGV